MKTHLCRLLLTLLLPLVCTSLIAQEDDGWKGDRHAFLFKNGRVSFRYDSKAGSALLWRTIAPPSGVPVLWQFGSYSYHNPTKQNTFALIFFSEILPTEVITYHIEPFNSGKELHLLRTTYTAQEGGKRGKVKKVEKLDALHLFSPKLDWLSLQVMLQYHPTQGVRLHYIGDEGRLVSGEWHPLLGGNIKWRIEFHTSFTKSTKYKYTYQLPTVTWGEAQETPLLYENVELEGRNKIVVTLNKPVDLTSAQASVSGIAARVVAGAVRNQLVILLSGEIAPEQLYVVEVTGIRSLTMGDESISFELDTRRLPQYTHTELPKQLLITEVMIAPPSSGPLAHQPYIELYNNTQEAIALHDQLLYFGKKQLHLPTFQLPPKAYVILTPTGGQLPLTSQVPQLELPSFPTFKSNFSLELYSSSRVLLDALHFAKHLYGPGEPNGGASLERLPQSTPTWHRSNHPEGGTPGFATTMQPFKEVPKGSVVINEIMLAPPTAGEKYIELYNTTSQPIDLAHLYLTYTNKEATTTPTAWPIVRQSHLIPPHGYVVLTPYPATLARLYPQHNLEALVERIDFPSLSPTYCQIELRSQASHQLVDNATYRKQWLGHAQKDRHGFALERRSPELDGTLPTTWQRATAESNGGTPGVQNSVHGTSSTHGTNPATPWPKDKNLTLHQVEPLLLSFGHLAKIELYTLTGLPIITATAQEVLPLFRLLQRGKAPLPTLLIVVRITFNNPAETPPQLLYQSTWLHTPATP